MLFTFFMNNTISWLNGVEVILEANTVHLYGEKLACSDMQLAYYEKIISLLELERAKKFAKESDQKKFIAQKAMTREILSRYLQQNPAEIEFELGDHGKPFLKNRALQFNVSHSGDYFLMGVTRDLEIGVDIECVQEHRDYLALARRFFTPAEFQAIKNKADFYQIWTCKEAFIKATGLGLSFGLSNFEVAISAGKKSALVSVQGDFIAAKKWALQLVALNQFDNYFAAFCVQGAVSSLNLQIKVY